MIEKLELTRASNNEKIRVIKSKISAYYSVHPIGNKQGVTKIEFSNGIIHAVLEDPDYLDQYFERV